MFAYADVIIYGTGYCSCGGLRKVTVSITGYIIVYCTGQVSVFRSNLKTPYLRKGILPFFDTCLPNYTMSRTRRSRYCNWTLWEPEISFTKCIRQVIKYHVVKEALLTVPSKSFVAVSIGYMEKITVLWTQVDTRNEIFLVMLLLLVSTSCL
jgi:hypothetical protein